VETTFSVSGIGNLLVQSVQSKDIPMIQGVALLFGAILILMNLLADLTYFAIDPRIRAGARA
jgi:peptide/nickel transport system permease protein